MGVEWSVSREDWSLHRKGQLDQQRHQEKVREAIKENLADIVSEESIITSDGNRIVKVPIRSLEEYRFRFDSGQGGRVGQGNGDSKVGDVVARESQDGTGKGKGAGEDPGQDYYEAEVSIDELAELIFADLALPNLRQKKKPEIASDSWKFNDIRKKGLTSNVDKRRTLLETLKRNALHGQRGFGHIVSDDLRFKTWEPDIRPQSNAVVMAMMDTSGSMGQFEKYIARSFFFWMVRFLRTKYENVQIVFLAHHTEAKEVTEQEFFTKGESGGTRCSSAYELALDLIEKRFSPVDYNIYPFHFSDGDNQPSDNARCVNLVDKLLEACNQVGYAEIGQSYYGSTLLHTLEQVEHPHLTLASIRDKADVYPTLKAFFRDRVEEEG